MANPTELPQFPVDHAKDELQEELRSSLKKVKRFKTYLFSLFLTFIVVFNILLPLIPASRLVDALRNILEPLNEPIIQVLLISLYFDMLIRYESRRENELAIRNLLATLSASLQSRLPPLLLLEAIRKQSATLPPDLEKEIAISILQHRFGGDRGLANKLVSLSTPESHIPLYDYRCLYRFTDLAERVKKSGSMDRKDQKLLEKYCIISSDQTFVLRDYHPEYVIAMTESSVIAYKLAFEPRVNAVWDLSAMNEEEVSRAVKMLPTSEFGRLWPDERAGFPLLTRFLDLKLGHRPSATDVDWNWVNAEIITNVGSGLDWCTKQLPGSAPFIKQMASGAIVFCKFPLPQGGAGSKVSVRLAGKYLSLRAEGYFYWSADRPTFVEDLTFDYSLFYRQGSKDNPMVFVLNPFVAPAEAQTFVEESERKSVCSVGGWVLPRSAVLLTWRPRIL